MIMLCTILPYYSTLDPTVYPLTKARRLQGIFAPNSGLHAYLSYLSKRNISARAAFAHLTARSNSHPSGLTLAYAFSLSSHLRLQQARS